MKLRIKVPLLFLLVILVFGLIIHYILNTVVLTSYIQLETQGSLKVSGRLQQSISDKLTALDSKSSDWANWDDTYRFIQDKNQAYITSNLQNPALDSLKINLMIFYNSSGNIVYSDNYDLSTKKNPPLPPLWESAAFRRKYSTVVDPSQNKLGLVNVDGRVMMIVMRQILTSNGTGPSRGMLVFGQYLDTKAVSDLEKIQKNPLKYYLYNDPKLPSDYKEARDYFQTGKSDAYILRETENKVDTYTLFNDVYGKHILIFEETLNRDIYQYGKRNTYLTELLITGVGLLSALFAIVVLLNNLILSRLARLTRQIQQIGPSGSLSARVGAYGHDELGLLAEEFNRTLLNLETATNEKLYQERQSQSLLSVIEEAVVLTDVNDVIIYTNPACEKFFGYTKEEMNIKRTSNTLKFFDINSKPLPQSYLEDLPKKPKTGKEITIYVEGKNKKVAALVTFSPIIVEKTPKGIIYVFHDVTAEVELNRQKDDFFSIASHELRTPLTVISGNIDNILQGYGKSTLTDSDKKSLADAMTSSDRLIRLVNDYLDVSRLDQRRYTLNIKPVDMCKLFESISNEMAPLFAKKGISFQQTCGEKQVLVMGDEDKIKEVFINLLGNSLKFTEHGGITITHELKDGMLVIDVTDTGIGIARDKQHLLFSRFQQAMNETAYARQAGGTGLGLYISREFVRLMGGELWLAKSELNQGSTFFFTLPLAKV